MPKTETETEPQIVSAVLTAVRSGPQSLSQQLCIDMEKAMSQAVLDYTAEGHAVDSNPPELRERVMAAREAVKTAFLARANSTE